MTSFKETTAFLRAALRIASRRWKHGPAVTGWSFRREALADALRRQMAELGKRGWENADWVGAREASRARAPSGRWLAQVKVEHTELGGVEVTRVTPPGKPGRTILYLPGGGFTQGGWETHAELVVRLARAAEAQLVMVHYRLAPEHPFPAAVEDVSSAWRALVREVEPRACVLAGDSAGGGLAVTSALAFAREGLLTPGALLCLSPWVDLSVRAPSTRGNAALDWYPPDALRRQGTLYLGKLPAEDPRVSPLHADLSHLPPTFLQVGSAEILLDDTRSLALALRGAGVEVALDEWPGMVHGWQFYPELLPEAVDAVERAGEFARGFPRSG